MRTPGRNPPWSPEELERRERELADEGVSPGLARLILRGEVAPPPTSQPEWEPAKPFGVLRPLRQIEQGEGRMSPVLRQIWEGRMRPGLRQEGEEPMREEESAGWLATNPRSTVWLHGTSCAALRRMLSGEPVRPVYTDWSASLGGVYLTTSLVTAKFYADDATRAEDTSEAGHGVVVRVTASATDLLPDEDWIERAFEETAGKIRDQRLRAFFDDLIREPRTAVDAAVLEHYKERYDDLNERHGITWMDSYRWGKSARLPGLLRPEQIVWIEDAETGERLDLYDLGCKQPKLNRVRNSDAAYRASERAFAAGDPSARSNILVNRLRVGLVSPLHLAVAGYLGDSASAHVVRPWPPARQVPDDERVEHALKHAGLEPELLARLVADFAANVLRFFEAASPNDGRPRAAIKTARAWAACPCEEHCVEASDATTTRTYGAAIWSRAWATAGAWAAAAAAVGSTRVAAGDWVNVAAAAGYAAWSAAEVARLVAAATARATARHVARATAGAAWSATLAARTAAGTIAGTAGRTAERAWQRRRMIAVLCGDPVRDPLGPPETTTSAVRTNMTRRNTDVASVHRNSGRAVENPANWTFSETAGALEGLSHAEPNHRYVEIHEAEDDALIFKGKRVNWLIDNVYTVLVPVDKILLTEGNQWNMSHARALLELIENGDKPTFKLPSGRFHRIDRRDVRTTESEHAAGQLEYQCGMLRPWEPEDAGAFYVKLLNGNHRALAAMAAGEDEVPVVVGPDYRRYVKVREWIKPPGGTRPAWWHRIKYERNPAVVEDPAP